MGRQRFVWIISPTWSFSDSLQSIVTAWDRNLWRRPIRQKTLPARLQRQSRKSSVLPLCPCFSRYRQESNIPSFLQILPHDIICLLVIAHHKRMRPDLVKAIPFVKAERLFVFLPNAEPDIFFLPPYSCADSLLHQTAP